MMRRRADGRLVDGARAAHELAGRLRDRRRQSKRTRRWWLGGTHEEHARVREIGLTGVATFDLELLVLAAEVDEHVREATARGSSQAGQRQIRGGRLPRIRTACRGRCCNQQEGGSAIVEGLYSSAATHRTTALAAWSTAM